MNKQTLENYRILFWFPFPFSFSCFSFSILLYFSFSFFFFFYSILFKTSLSSSVYFLFFFIFLVKLREKKDNYWKKNKDVTFKPFFRILFGRQKCTFFVTIILSSLFFLILCVCAKLTRKLIH